VVLLALMFTAGSCSSADTDPAPTADQPPPSSSPPSPSPSPSTFVSQRHGYSLQLAPGWQVAEYGGTWSSLDELSPSAEVPGEDVASSNDSPGFLVANSMTIPTGMSSEAWLAEVDRRVASGSDPDCRASNDTGMVAGEEARIIHHLCADREVIGRSLTHAGRGYYFTIGFPAGDATTAATLETIVATIDFTGG
jgi:hypothetical protein